MNELKELEILMGWKMLCEKLEITRMTLWRWQRGEYEPRISQWKNIEKLLAEERKKWKETKN